MSASATFFRAPARVPAPSVRRHLATAAGGLARRVRRALRAADSRPGFARPDDRMLADLGISRAQAAFAAGRAARRD